MMQFREAIISAGLHPPEVIDSDGRLHRFAANDKPKDSAGWYVFHGDGIPAGAFGDWRTKATTTWRADIGRPLSQQEEAGHRDRVNAMRREREAEDISRKADAVNRAAAIWAAAQPAPNDHAYLAAKGVKGHGLRVHNGALAIQMRDGHDLHSLQFISADGTKRFLSGGRVSGCYFSIGDQAGGLCIAEGYATGASIHEATGCAVAIAFNAGNLLPVALALRAKFTKLPITVCADDDAGTPGNPGLTKAREAAQAIGALLAVPYFGNDRPAGATDFNDLHQHAGLEAVRAGVQSARRPEFVADVAEVAVAAAVRWPEPQPLDRQAANPVPYPIDAFPGKIGAAVREYQAYGQQPVAMVASSALAVVSLAAQGLANVARDAHLVGPLSLYSLVIAPSGERKTAADKAMSAPLGEWEREQGEALREDIGRSIADLGAWEAEQEGLKAAIKAAVYKKPADVDGLRQRLMEHATTKPVQMIAPRLKYEDVNPQSLVFMLATGHPSAALWSDEGGMVTGSHGMGKDSMLGFMVLLNRLWDGGEIHHDRKQAASVHLEGRRLTVSLMVQRDVLRELTQRSGGLARGSGFLARYLVAAPQSTMGSRMYREAPKGMPAVAAFHQRVRELLDSPLPLDEQGRLALPVLRMSDGAFGIWRDYHNAVEHELRPLGDYETACDFASKSAENAARIAGCIQVFNGAQGAIPHETMRQATLIARWYLDETLRVLDVLDEPQRWSDARILDAWLAEAGNASLRDVLRLGPRPLREKARRNAALEVLVELGRARLGGDGHQMMLERNPALKGIATATRATLATRECRQGQDVADVAPVAVADEQIQEAERGEF